MPAKLAHPAPKPVAAYDTAQSFAAPTHDWPQDRWWVAYGDPQLSALIDEALRGTPDLREAQVRIEKADAIARQQGAALLPTLDANANVGELRQSYNLGIPTPHGWNDTGQGTLNFNWEIDFWGKNRAALAAATSEAQAARADAAAARLALSTSIAMAYAYLATLFAERAATIDAIKVREQTLALIQYRHDNGLENEGAAQRSQSARATAQAELGAIDETIALGRNRIAALLGDGPDRGLAILPPGAMRLTAVGLPANLPAQLLGRQPEIAAARLRAQAAASRIKVAKAAFYPNVNLSAFVGTSALGLNLLTKSGSMVGSVGPAISLPIFEGGRLRGQYREAEADYDIAVAQYDGAVTHALHDVADAITSDRALATRLDRTRAAATAAGAAWQIADNRYRGGLATYLDVLTAEDALIATRRSVADLETRGFTLDIALVRALGGGFRSDQGKSS